jgi:succinoglycan biosynthesis transport protein ExoP
MSTSALPFGPDGVRTPVETSDLDLRYYSGVLWRGRWLVVVAMVLGVALSSLVAYLQVPEYQARSLVQIEPPVPFFMGVNEALMGGGGYWQNTDFYNTQFKIITSKAIADRVIDELKLKDKAPFSEMKDASGLFLSHIAVEPVPESRLVYILVSHEDPEEAALWANQVADVYIRHSLDQRVESARKAFDWLRERLQTTEAQMKEQNDRLYRQYQEQDFVPSGTTSAVNSSIEKLQGELVDVQSKRIALDAAYRQALDLKSRKQSLESVPQIAQDSSWVGLQAQVTAMELERQRLKEKYRDSHPEMVRIDTLIKGVRQKKDERAAEVIVLMEKERAQLQKREAELRSATEEQKSVAAGQNRRVAELDTIKKQASSASGMYDVLLQKLNESNIATSVQTNNIALVDKAVGGVKVKPNQRQAALTGLAIGLLLGIGLVLGRDYFDNTIKDPDEVERYLHLDLLAVVPKYDESNVHLVTEAYQNLRTALIFARREDSGQVVLITGTAPQEGKTSTIVNLAKLLAASGEKTLVMDLDLRRAQVHRRLGVPKEPGFSDYFIKREELDRLVQPTKSPNLFVLTAGALPPNPPALIARKQMGDLLDRLRRHFDWILVDSPPLASVTDALLLARYCDLAVYVVQHNKIDKKAIKRSILALQKVTPNLLGVVINALDIKTRGYYYYYYHQDHKVTGEVRRPAKGSPAPKGGPAAKV